MGRWRGAFRVHPRHRLGRPRAAAGRDCGSRGLLRRGGPHGRRRCGVLLPRARRVAFPNAVDAQAIRAEIERAALEVYRAYSVRDLGRVDLIWDGGAARCFEVDVSPGMTERSLFPMACAAAGLSLPAVLDTLVNEAYARGACF
ncbi:MAG: hypothetical protein ACLTDR_03555 [Adlercreutzia equolifaciens]